MRTAHTRRLLGTGAVALWSIAGISTSLFIFEPSLERYKATLVPLVGLAICSTTLWCIASRTTSSTQPPAGGTAEVTDITRRLDEIETRQHEQTQHRDRIAGALQATAAAVGNADTALAPSPEQIELLAQACDAPAGSPPREVTLEVLGRLVTRTVTPGSSPYAVWYDMCDAIIEYVKEHRNDEDLLFAGRGTQNPAGPRRGAQNGSQPPGQGPAGHTPR